ARAAAWPWCEHAGQVSMHLTNPILLAGSLGTRSHGEQPDRAVEAVRSAGASGALVSRARLALAAPSTGRRGHRLPGARGPAPAAVRPAAGAAPGQPPARLSPPGA